MTQIGHFDFFLEDFLHFQNYSLVKVLEAERYRLSLLEEKIREVLTMLRTLNTMVSIFLSLSHTHNLLLYLSNTLSEAERYRLSLPEEKIREVLNMLRTLSPSERLSLFSVWLFLYLLYCIKFRTLDITKIKAIYLNLYLVFYSLSFTLFFFFSLSISLSLSLSPSI